MKKISVIFFLACIFIIFIYNKFKSDNINILYLGDLSVLNNKVHFDIYNNIEKYTYDSVTYKDIENEIKNNSYKVIKENNVYLNQLISKSDVIIISANNFKYSIKCNKSNSNLLNYDKVINSEIDSLVDTLNKISSSKIYIIGNYCRNKEHNQIINSSKIEYINYNKLTNIEDIIRKTINN